MDLSQQTQTVLGLDLGAIHTRAALFGIEDGKYRLLGQGTAPSTLGAGQYPGEGVGKSLERLQRGTDYQLLSANGRLIQPATSGNAGLDQVFLSLSSGPTLRTVALGLTRKKSLAAVKALTDSRLSECTGVFGLADLADESGLVDRLVEIRPDLLILTGGETGGAEDAVKRLINVARNYCLLLPPPLRPSILFAGNEALESWVKRRIEPLAPVMITSNLLSSRGGYDLVPAQSRLDSILSRFWVGRVPGLRDVLRLTDKPVTTASAGMERMVRFLSRSGRGESQRGVIALDLGGAHTSLAAGLNGSLASLDQDAWEFLSDDTRTESIKAIRKWLSEEIEPDQVAQYLHQHRLHPELVPVTGPELAIEMALARVRLGQSVQKLVRNFPELPYDPDRGWSVSFEPIIASGSVLTQAAHPGQTMLMLLDGLQPCGVTTLVLDQHHLLPLLGAIAETNQVLPVQIMETDAFLNLGTVITPVSTVPDGERVMTLEVTKESGSSFSVEIPQGVLRRVVIQVGEPATLKLIPEKNTDVGLGGAGIGGRLKIRGGVLGLVVDARGRPLKLPEKDEERVALIQRWLWTLSG